MTRGGVSTKDLPAAVPKEEQQPRGGGCQQSSSSSIVIYTYMDDIDKLESEHLVCSICHEPMINPVLIPHCGHLFCRHCIVDWISRHSTCPMCNGDAGTVDSLAQAPAFFSDRLNNLPVLCPSSGCSVVRKELESHLVSCPTTCRENCGRRMVPAELEQHYLVDCPNSTVVCPMVKLSCSWRGPRKRLEEHLPKCQHTPPEVLVCFRQLEELSLRLMQHEENTKSLQAKYEADLQALDIFWREKSERDALALQQLQGQVALCTLDRSHLTDVQNSVSQITRWTTGLDLLPRTKQFVGTVGSQFMGFDSTSVYYLSTYTSQRTSVSKQACVLRRATFTDPVGAKVEMDFQIEKLWCHGGKLILWGRPSRDTSEYCLRLLDPSTLDRIGNDFQPWSAIREGLQPQVPLGADGFLFLHSAQSNSMKQNRFYYWNYTEDKWEEVPFTCLGEPKIGVLGSTYAIADESAIRLWHGHPHASCPTLTLPQQGRSSTTKLLRSKLFVEKVEKHTFVLYVSCYQDSQAAEPTWWEFIRWNVDTDESLMHRTTKTCCGGPCDWCFPSFDLKYLFHLDALKVTRYDLTTANRDSVSVGSVPPGGNFQVSLSEDMNLVCYRGDYSLNVFSLESLRKDSAQFFEFQG